MKRYLLFLFVLFSICACSSIETRQDISKNTQFLSDWNKRVLEIAEREDGFLTLKGVRTLSMMHIAMHDAINAVDNKFTPYAYSGSHRQIDPREAAIYAAFYVATDQYSENKHIFNELLNQQTSQQTRLQKENAGLSENELGFASAQAILTKRDNDRWSTEAEYSWHPMAPGVYAEFNEHSGTPQGFIFGAGWAKVAPFVLSSHDQFRAPPPPKINSNAYTEAFNEVKRVGAHKSQSRTADQTHLAMWWKDFSENSHNRLARQLIAEKSLSLHDSARLFALINMSIFDAYINVFDNKFFYNHWRPYTAIRWADKDGNPDTELDENWTNTHNHTYAFPSYPSAHGTACTAAMAAFSEVFGDKTQFTMTTSSVDKAGPFSGKIAMEPTTRSFTRFSEAALECSMSRVYLGIHFRYDSIEGNKLGDKIGKYVIEQSLNPIE